ncbi:hypothetical protein [Bacillus sp. XF8]|uniref:hypothetical protein n=1 Tax=Bacillus sp. XF8 TaxID=2819289 RepID=UPI001AA09812|nr:hypothetical protein [Bacillus sp. XF8]MBO1583280.1 hypothetical protein [Bacillus sp. XF8]
MIYDIPQSCMNKWTTIRLDLANQTPSTFSFLPVNAENLKNRFLYGYIYTAEYKPTECITQQQQLIIGCQNKWVYMFPVRGGDFVFWPTKFEAHNPKLILGWLNITNNMNLQCEAAPSIFNITGNWKTDYGQIVFTQTGQNVTGSYPNGRVEGKLVFNQAKSKWELIGKWYEGIREGKILFTFDTFNKFTGIFGRGAEEPIPGNVWNGDRTV